MSPNSPESTYRATTVPINRNINNPNHKGYDETVYFFRNIYNK